MLVVENIPVCYVNGERLAHVSLPQLRRIVVYGYCN